MTTTVHLIGGGPGAMRATRRHIKDALAASTTVKKPRVAYVGAATNDNPTFRALFSGLFIGTGACLEPVRLARKTSKVSTARQLLHDCDVIFMGGGDVDHGMKLLNDRGVADDLRALAGAGKPIIGISAGSIMTCQSWVRFGDDDSAETFACLGIAPLHMDAHSEDDGWSELRVLVSLLAAAGRDPLGYGVPSKGCLRVDLDGKGAAKLRALGAPITRLGARKGQPVERTPLAP